MSSSPQSKLPTKVVSIDEIASIRDKYLGGIQEMESEMQRLTTNRQATAGAVEALNKLIEQFSPKVDTPAAK